MITTDAAPLDGVRVRGSALPEEVAAVLAVLTGRASEVRMSRYEQWRQARQATLRDTLQLTDVRCSPRAPGRPRA